MRVFLTMIAVVFMLIGLIAIQKNHRNHLKSYTSWSFLRSPTDSKETLQAFVIGLKEILL